MFTTAASTSHDTHTAASSLSATRISVQEILTSAGIAPPSSAAGSALSAALKQGLPWVMSGLDLVGPAVPLFAPVLSLITRAYGAVCAMRGVRQDVAALEERLRRLGVDWWELWQLNSGGNGDGGVLGDERFKQRAQQVRDRGRESKFLKCSSI